ncbi:MAG: polymer-forming cytoskeletal protein [Bacteroidota bacterium]
MNSSNLSLPFPSNWFLLLFNPKTKANEVEQKKKEQSPVSNQQNWRNQSGPMSLIADGTVIEGKVSFSDDARIDGKIIGTITCSKKLVLGSKSKIEGEMETGEIHLEGHFSGNLNVHQLAYLGSTAKLEGTIHANQVQMESGAILNADCHIGS